MSINKVIKRFKPMAQWSPMIITVCLYILFIMVVLSISFPLKSNGNVKHDRIESERKNRFEFMSHQNDDDRIDDRNEESINDNTINNDDDNRLGENERRFIQRAHYLPSFSNRSDVLRDAFQR